MYETCAGLLPFLAVTATRHWLCSFSSATANDLAYGNYIKIGR